MPLKRVPAQAARPASWTWVQDWSQ